ncbi:MAG: endonuclease/exonuclease/phosphatase family protein [Dysgonamonadaceae bacterium]
MTSTFSIMFYNTENYYDTVDDPEILDDDFTPKGFRNWTEERFNDKTEKIAKVIEDIVSPDFPDIIGLAEVENKEVMMALLNQLRKNHNPHYSFVHFDSPDERGSDVAMIYKTDTFKIIETYPIKVQLPGIEDRTRDFLYVKGRLKNEEILHFFFVHFPSRRAGTEETERRRYFVASELRNEVQKVMLKESDAKIIVAGDFNDTPDNNGIDEILNAQKTFENPNHDKLYNLLYPRYQKGLGTTYHKGWLLFDQFLVTGNLLSAGKTQCSHENADIFNPRYLLFINKNGESKPDRTYSGKYTGGYSDHLPVYLRLTLNDSL